MNAKYQNRVLVPSWARRSLWLIVWMCVGVPVAQAQISVVVAKGSPHTATQAQLKDYFSGARVTWANGARVQVVDQPDAAVGTAFYQALLGRTPAQVRVQWTKLVLSGQAQAPIKAADDDAVKKAVAANPNAVGFIRTDALDGTVKEVVRLP